MLAVFMVAALLTGCMGQDVSVSVGSDGSCSYTMKYLYESSTYQNLMSMGNDSDMTVLKSGDFVQTQETIDGKTYECFARTINFAGTAQLQQFLTNYDAYLAGLKQDSKAPSAYTTDSITGTPFKSVIVDTTQFVGELTGGTTEQYSGMSPTPKEDTASSNVIDCSNLSSSSSGYESFNDTYKAMGLIINVSVTLPSPVLSSNGTVSGNTATWSINTLPDGNKLIASTVEGVITSDTTAPVISGVEDGKVYNKKKVVTVTDDVCVQSVQVDGFRINTTMFSFSKTGKYSITALDCNQNATTLTFQIDKKAPKIIKKKKGKGYLLKFSDASGIKKVTVNGKSVGKSKAVIKKKGTYTVKVTDKMGNTKKIKLKVK